VASEVTSTTSLTAALSPARYSGRVLRLLRLLVPCLALGASTGVRAQAGPAPQVPNPLPRGVLDEPAIFDPAADEPVPASTPLPSTTPTPTTERVRLIYAPGAFAAICPPADDVPGLVRQYLARDPFGEPATRLALIALDGDGPDPERARVEILDLRLEPIGSRVVDAKDGCGELVDTAAFQLALALEPIAGIAGSAPATPPTTPSTTPAAGPTAPPAPVEAPPTETPTPTPTPLTPEGDEPELFLSGAVHIAALLAPEGVMPGLAVGAGARWSAFSARVEGRFDLSGDEQGTTSFPVIATVMPCAHLPLIDLDAEFPNDFDDGGVIEASACLTASAGVMPALGVYTGFGLYAGSGARVGVDWRLPGEITLRTFGQLEAAGLRPVLVNIGSGNLYQSPAFNVLFGFGMDLPDL